MRQSDDRLSRLLRSASHARQPVPQDLPVGFETRVLAYWRAALDESSTALIKLFRHALIGCCALMMLTIAICFRTLNAPASLEVSLANSAIEISLP